MGSGNRRSRIAMTQSLKLIPRWIWNGPQLIRGNPTRVRDRRIDLHSQQRITRKPKLAPRDSNTLPTLRKICLHAPATTP